MTFSRELSPAWGRHVGDSLEEHSGILISYDDDEYPTHDAGYETLLLVR